jgi:energy-coupling factor transporter ATP-binding protein EcfA2
MRLKKFEYAERRGMPQEWTLSPFELGHVNLLVGKNATGKTRCLNVIAALADLLTQRRRIRYGEFSAHFDDEGVSIFYHLNLIGGEVKAETFKSDGEILLARESSGRGVVFAQEIKQKMKFGLPVEEIAAATKTDSIQHPFLERLSMWAKNLRHYRFGESMGHTSVVIIDPKGPPPDPRDPNQVVPLFRRGEKQVPGFGEIVRKDLEAIGYAPEEIGVTTAELPLEVPLPATPLGLFVKENGLPGPTHQLSMSQGMFRALSTLVHVNYAQYVAPASCVLLDDVGEGLDFERSHRLIKLLVDKAESGNFQLIMTTNDRFVMNAVPLTYWGVVIRDGSHCRVLSKASDPNVFNEFEFTGLNNFDFLATEFWKKSSSPN